MSEPVVLLNKDGGISTVTLNRPEKLNALNRELRGAFCRTMQELRGDPETLVVIITGAGRAFCAGLDLRELGSGPIRDEGNATFVTVIEDLEVPVIAAVNGFAVTGGFELALACDLIVAAQEAQFADTHARVGVMPGGGMSARLPRAVGIRKARELSFTGNYLDAEAAERMGLVNRVVPRDQLMATARELAHQIQGANQPVVQQMKKLYDRTSRVSLDDGLRIEQDFFRAFNSASRLDDMEARREAVMNRGRSQTGRKS
ncbi:MAG TPA: enoyl-CoA hydratase [Candidatus Binataceae bacterium]|nr:enoyl-CoA hydratase [Candidatus Binataceae bacterium]